LGLGLAPHRAGITVWEIGTVARVDRRLSRAPLPVVAPQTARSAPDLVPPDHWWIAAVPDDLALNSIRLMGVRVRWLRRGLRRLMAVVAGKG